MQDMDKDFGKIYRIFEKVTNTALDMQCYPHRLMLQKITYLMQEMGNDYGYRFSWYLNGPYSTGLARDSFEFVADEKKPGNVQFTGKEEQAMASLAKHFGEEAKSDDELELLGSLVFIKKDMGITEREVVIEKLRSRKPWFKRQRAEKMLDKIEASRLFN